MRSSVLLINVLFFIAADLKRICETENGSLKIKDDRVRQMLKKNGLTTQCIQAKNAKLCKDMTLAQLCLKINSKMGGANNAIANNSITRLVFLPLRIIHQQRKSLTVKKDIKVYFFYLSINAAIQSSNKLYMLLAIQLAVLEMKILRLWITWIIPGNLFGNIICDYQNQFEDAIFTKYLTRILCLTSSYLSDIHFNFLVN